MVFTISRQRLYKRPRSSQNSLRSGPPKSLPEAFRERFWSLRGSILEPPGLHFHRFSDVLELHFQLPFGARAFARALASCARPCLPRAPLPLARALATRARPGLPRALPPARACHPRSLSLPACCRSLLLPGSRKLRQARCLLGGRSWGRSPLLDPAHELR